MGWGDGLKALLARLEAENKAAQDAKDKAASEVYQYRDVPDTVSPRNNLPKQPTIDDDIQRTKDRESAPENLQVALSRKPVSVKRGLLASAMPANPYFDLTQVNETNGPNPYLMRSAH